MSELRFTEDHEWLRAEADGSVTVGITAYAQRALGDVVYVQLPELQHYEAGAEASTVESVKAASGVYMPLAGEVVAVNEQLAEQPEQVNEQPLGEGWFFRFVPDQPEAVAALLDQDAYDRLLTATADA
ncbi:glycine cleavage system protein GcvH [Pseudomonas sp.]|uniref:glycine cleavage system protein GcvH n=1 Tax=Pseudomonas sp. TaxID=306 RepID=UPI0028AA167E|nr:glycine cleavage system protein GcvH [Pseudomonas sp.]